MAEALVARRGGRADACSTCTRCSRSTSAAGCCAGPPGSASTRWSRSRARAPSGSPGAAASPGSSTRPLRCRRARAAIRDAPRPFTVGTVAVVSPAQGQRPVRRRGRPAARARRRAPSASRWSAPPTTRSSASGPHEVLARARDGRHPPHPPRAGVFERLAQWDAFVLPSRADPFPISMLEAMASGLPVVGTRRDGIVEQIADGTGLLIEPEDPRALADAIAWCAAQPAATRERMGTAARDRVDAAFTLAHQAAACTTPTWRRWRTGLGARRRACAWCPGGRAGRDQWLGSAAGQVRAAMPDLRGQVRRSAPQPSRSTARAPPALAPDAASGQLHVAVHDPRGDVVARGDVAGDAVGDGDRAVAPAGAADRDRQVGLALGDVGREQEVEQRQQPPVVLARELARPRRARPRRRRGRSAGAGPRGSGGWAGSGRRRRGRRRAAGRS